MKTVNRRQFLKLGGAGLASIAFSPLNIPIFAPRRAFARTSNQVFKFGVMADTQWQTGTDAVDPASCATTIIDILNDQFIRHGCKFVIQVGDLVDKETVDDERTLPTRAAHAAALYDAGIGFFPLRGNHESSAEAALELTELFPQTLGSGPNLFGAKNFASPKISASYCQSDCLAGLTYMFDYQNVRCVLIDQFVRADGTNYNKEEYYGSNAVDQVEWIDQVLSANSLDRHSFVFAHKNLIGQSHKDNLFGWRLTDNADVRDRFIESLYNNGVRYFLSGHDHMHNYSIVRSSDLLSSVGQIICASNSYKFYVPKEGDDGRETPMDQELFTIGYYIFTVNGPQVTVDYYSASHGQDYGDASLLAPPDDFAFYLRDTFGYSVNGNDFEVAQGESYTKIEDIYEDSTAQILSGANDSGLTDYLGRSLAKMVCTGWSNPTNSDKAASKILYLWGLSDNLALYNQDLEGLLPDCNAESATDVYTLSLSYNKNKLSNQNDILKGKFGLAARNGNKWVNAVDLNYGGTKNFRLGPFEEGYDLGTWGVDTDTNTVWAVINHDGEFVAKYF